MDSHDLSHKKNIELLAPAKNLMALKASALYADAVYIGLESFNMRMKADNFTLNQLPLVVDLCHHPNNPNHRKRKVYLTLNTVIFDHEIASVKKTILTAKMAGIDAIIAHDLSTIQLAKEIGIPFHISTQCNVSNTMSAQFYESIGADRIILARECSLNQIKKITCNLKSAEVEAFIHGAMCSSISGRCYLSQTIACSNKQSANRGLCTQPCRGTWKLKSESGFEFIYDGQRIFNSRDLCMINYIPELIESGLRSFKIEGRMRHPHYVETVTRCYREAIDASLVGKFNEAKKQHRWITQLKQIYNRGFTTGFYFNLATAKDSQLRSPANISHFRYIEMGRIQKYFPSKIAKIELTNGTLKVGDEIIIMSTNSEYDTYFTQKVHDIQINQEYVENTPRANKAKPVVITIKLDDKTNENGIDAIYKFTDETYQRPKKVNKSRKRTSRNSYVLK